MSKEPTITKDGLKAILADVTAQVDTLIKSEKDKLETLAKSHPGEETPSEPPADTSAVKSAPESSGPEASADDKPADGPPGAPPTEAAPAPTDAPPAGDAPVDPAAEVGPIDPAQLKAEYSQLSIEDLQVHYMAAKEALTEAMAAQQPAPAPGAVPGAAPAVAPPVAAPPVAPPSPLAAAPAPAPVAAPPVAAPPAEEPPFPAQKSEKDLRIETLEKSEKETAESLNKLAGVLDKVLKAPLRKSIVSMTELGGEKPKLAYKDMNRAQIDKALKDKIASGTLKKSDTDLIVAYDVGKGQGSVKIDQLAHLFV